MEVKAAGVSDATSRYIRRRGIVVSARARVVGFRAWFLEHFSALQSTSLA